ncbi:FGGY-family carbohydrate kinase [Ideonella livida]|uniref:FGGY-family carbohydrate kinase n=1 Tax=Ideonella livida TaxID=2707176 RepID=A0A7C9PJ26_9BURK|nr:FGGY-family carbohydrate kinase [Ideonella livida]NDY92929.1 FGGY-family carbohydrate kinase [Ideonella livida]
MTPSASLTPLAVGLDLGTSGVRAVALDAAGALRAQARVALPAPLRQPGPDGLETLTQNPALWWQAVRQALAALVAQLGPAARGVRTLAVDGTSGTLLMTDAHGQALGPAWMYADASAPAEAARVAACAPADSPARGAASPLARALRLCRLHPQGAHLLHQADWIAAQLRGPRPAGPAPLAVSDENNVLKLGFDLQACAWPDWFSALQAQEDAAALTTAPGARLQAALPLVLAPGTPLGPLDPGVAAALGLPPDTLVAAGTTDGVAAFLATGACAVGDGVTSLGSTLVLKQLCAQPVQAAAWGVYSHRLGGPGGLWLAGGASNSGGAALLQHFSAARMAELTPRLRPEEPTGLDYHPLAGVGERFPVNDPAQTSRTTPRPDDDLRFFQGLLEGVAGVEALGYQRLAELGAGPLRRVFSVGGGARNPGWTTLRQRRLGVPLCQPPHDEAACGAARLAWQALGHTVGPAGPADTP